MQRWEYLTQILEANVDEAVQRMEMSREEAEGLARYAPEALMPDLNRLGDKGWELIHFEPVIVGSNSDLLILEGGGMRRWSNRYLCVFKRPA